MMPPKILSKSDNISKTSSDAVRTNDQQMKGLVAGASALSIAESPSTDERDDASASLRSTKVWNEPTYTKPSPAPIKIPEDNDDVFSPQTDSARSPLKIAVERGSTFFSDPIRNYPMYSCPRGHVLIINNQEFDNPELYPDRKGAHVDGENLEKLFKGLGFVVNSHKNLKRNETLKTLINFADLTEHEKADMVVVCILSHGENNNRIVSADGLRIDTETDVLR